MPLLQVSQLHDEVLPVSQLVHLGVTGISLCVEDDPRADTIAGGVLVADEILRLGLEWHFQDVRVNGAFFATKKFLGGHELSIVELALGRVRRYRVILGVFALNLAEHVQVVRLTSNFDLCRPTSAFV